MTRDFGGRRAAFISMLRQRTSVALHTANAAAIARWRRLCWNSESASRPSLWVRALLLAKAVAVSRRTNFKTKFKTFFPLLF